MELVEFLEARIGEDEAAAQKMAENANWVADCNEPHDSAINVRLGDARWEFGPARLLAECAVKRRIVARYLVCEPNYDEGNRLEARVLDWTMRLLALPYADHPDYRQEWAL